MPIKYDKFDIRPEDSTLSNAPLVERLKDKEKRDSFSDMMSNIIKDKQTIKSSSLIDMIGTLTTVNYYHLLPMEKNNLVLDANGPNDVSVENKKFKLIKDFKVKLNGELSLENEGEEDNKSYITSGSLIILPRTIKPYENDYFTMYHYGKIICYRITSVTDKSFEEDSGFECEYVLYKEDYEPKEVVDTYVFIQELVGTNYRPVLTPLEYKNLRNVEEIYHRISDTFNNIFYNRNINSHLLKYNTDDNCNNENINNIIYKSDNGILIRTAERYIGDSYNKCPSMCGNPTINSDSTMYDPYLEKFISKNRIFRDFEGLIISPDSILPVDNLVYKRSIFGCIESTSISNYKNMYISAANIDTARPSVNGFLVGKASITHVINDTGVDLDLIPKNLISKLKNAKSINMFEQKHNDIVFSSYTDLIIDLIVRYVYKKEKDVYDGLVDLYKDIDELNEDNIKHTNIYYLFPIFGYIIEKTLEKRFHDNILFA